MRGVDDPSYLNCSSTIQCGGLQNASYPFWGLNRASYCGLSEFELTCQDNATALVTIVNQAYRVLRIDNTSPSMTVARNDYWNTICPSNLINTTQDITSPFSYTTDTVANLTLYYGCPPSPIQITSSIASSQFHCTINGTYMMSYFVTKLSNGMTYGGVNLTDVMTYYKSCNTSMVLAASRSAVQEIELNSNNMTVVSAINKGFGLQWTADDKCNGCLGSGGQCGRNETSEDFVCYCRDKSYSSACSGM
ncbi:hypothetical protein EUGRSUZ_F02104 [Eucalyptus grandis]|uniref:non-specific serine/threonine protein kinase n=2 Tax=Eucalyptus grandis TaxID=71139 RepID=A0A059BQM9_EUCGR|nr:hypothetical protein EUGRSUZ_F02104 [Eucalyptus grandis]